MNLYASRAERSLARKLIGDSILLEQENNFRPVSGAFNGLCGTGPHAAGSGDFWNGVRDETIHAI